MVDLRKFRTEECTCCKQPRAAAYVPDGESFHRDDNTFAYFLHAHVASEGRDCDGITGDYWVELPHAGEAGVAGEEGSDFWARVVRRAVNPFAIDGELTLKHEDGQDPSVFWRESTEEGWRTREARQCEAPWCARERSSRYDQYAEAMGY